MATKDPPPPAAIQTSSLDAGYPGEPPILKGIDLALHPGEILGIAGANGAGKSTLLKTLCGLLEPRSGNIEIQGKGLKTYTSQERATQVAAVLQTTPGSIPYTVREFVGHGRYPHTGSFGKMTAQDEEAVHSALETCALTHLSSKYTAELSAGESQRVLLAKALAQQCPVLLLDEPNAHLDPQHQRHLSGILRQKAKEDNTAILLVIHDLQLARELCDRIILLHDGKVHAEGEPDEVLNEENLGTAYPQIDASGKTKAAQLKSAPPWLRFLPALLLLFAMYASLQTGEMGTPSLEDILALLRNKLGFSPTDSLTPIQTIFWELRLPRALLGLFVGANIAVAGALMQGYFRNALAEPYVAGVSAGAACGAVIVLTTGLASTLSLPQAIALPLAAFLGAILSTWAVYQLSTRQGRTSTKKLLLGGIAIGGILQAVTIGLLLQADPHNMQNVLSWLMGSLAYRGWEHVPAVSIGGIAGLAIALLLARPLDLLAAEGENALALGVPVQTIRRILLATACFLAATSVASCGIIAFVGLMAPHITRMLYGARHIRLLPQTAILGALLLTSADILARKILPSQELPIGIITGVLGAVFLLFLLCRKTTGWENAD